MGFGGVHLLSTFCRNTSIMNHSFRYSKPNGKTIVFYEQFCIETILKENCSSNSEVRKFMEQNYSIEDTEKSKH